MKHYIFSVVLSVISVCISVTLNISGVFGQTMMGPYMLYDNHYLIDKYILNPAFAGSQYYPKAFIGTQRMELQIHDSPTIHIAGMHSRVGIRGNYSSEYKSGNRSAQNAVGGMIFADNNGPYQAVGIKLDYVYHVPLNWRSTTLSFGLGGILFSKRVKLDKYNSVIGNDPLIAENTGDHVMVPDFNAGVVFSHSQLYIGFSVSQLLENSYRFSTFKYTPAKVFRNYYLLAGYRFVYDGFELEPSLAVGRNLAADRHGNNGNFVDTNMEFFLKPIVFTVSYRVNGYLTTAISYRTRKLELGMRAELFSTKANDAQINGIGLMASYSFLPSHD